MSLGLPEERWSVRNVKRNALVDTDWFLSGLCCIAAAAPKTLNLVFPGGIGKDQEGGDSARVERSGESEEAPGTGEEAIGPRAHRSLVDVSLFRDGNWVTTQVDTRLPCSGGAELLAPQCESDEEGGGMLWAALAEKALAIMLGGYKEIESGAAFTNVPTALLLVTGGQTRTIELGSQLSSMWMQNGYLWSMLRSWCAPARPGTGGLVVVCVADRSSQHQFGFHDGLVPGLAYPIIGVGDKKRSARGGRESGPSRSSGMDDVRGARGRLVRLANPWGPQAQWRGAMSNGSPELETLQLQDGDTMLQGGEGSAYAAPASAARGGGWVRGTPDDSSAFWMTFEDWCKHFTSVHVCRLVPQGWLSASCMLQARCKVHPSPNPEP